MGEERILILEMLATGKIDGRQADELLESLESPTPGTLPPARAALKPPSLRLSAEQILELGAHGVSPKFIRETHGIFPDIDVEQIIELYNHGISIDFLRELRDENLLGRDPAAVIDIKEERAQGADA